MAVPCPCRVGFQTTWDIWKHPSFIYIDTEDKSVPTIVGSGLEDYFNGGWYFREGEFCGELHGVPIKDPLRSMVSMYRYHEQDAILFQ